MKRKVLVVAPHPDDEVLGVGGTIAKLAGTGDQVFVSIMTKGFSPITTEERIHKNREDALRAHRLLRVKETIFLDLPVASLNTVPNWEMNRQILDVFKRINPDIVFIPFCADVHVDHQMIALSCMVASRPNYEDFPKTIYAYETLSETNWNAPYVTPAFVPNVFVDITGQIKKKVAAFKCFTMQVKKFPKERSLQAIRALATLRGSTVGVDAAEGFVLLRRVVSGEDMV
jgi:LmbE family N-acetylglucosaminyl deacetylase